MAPNLAISNVLVNGNPVDTSPFSVLAGELFSVDWIVTNIGDESIAGVPGGFTSTASVNIDAVYLSDDNVLDAGDVQVGSYTNTSGLAPNGFYNGSASFSLFANTPGSLYPLNKYLIFVANATSSVGESDAQDNIALVPITVNAIDLSLDSATVAVGSPPQLDAAPPLSLGAVGVGYGSPVNIMAGQYIDVSWNGSNLGNQAVNDHYDGVYLSQDLIFDENDVFLTGRNQFLGNSNTFSFGVNSVYVPIDTGISDQAYVLFVADANNQIAESDESNNAYAVAVNISTDLPDLVFSDVTVPTDINAGQPISVSWTVNNQGTGSTLSTDWYDRVYLSDDTILGAEDLQVGNRYHSSGLNSNASYTQSNVLLNNIPTNAIGTKYLLFATDTDRLGGGYGGGGVAGAAPPLGSSTLLNNGSVLESDENNNVAFQEIIIKAADLTPSSVVSSTPNVEYGTAFNVTWTTNNAGNGNTFVPSNSQLFLSSDSIAGNSDDILIFSGTDVASIAGDTYTQTAAVTINYGNSLNPLPTDTGGYVSEVEDNNTLATANDLQQNLVLDTVANSYIVRAKGVVESSGAGDYYRIFASPGDTLTINQNAYLSVNGIGAIGDSYLYLYDRNGTLLRQDDDGGPDLSSFIQYILPNTAYAGEYYIRAAGYLSSTGGYGLTVQQQTTSPLLGIGGNGVAPGDYYLVAKTDGSNAILESNESNNFAVSTNRINVSVPANSPDLTIIGNSPTTASFGSTVPISWTVTNNGSNSAPSGWFDYVYLSDDDVIGTGDTVVASFTRGVNEPVLAAGESYTVNRNVTLPGGILGNKFLLFSTDRANNRPETNETNNLSTAAIQLVAPDLSVSIIATPPEGISGQSISVSWTVNNQGTGAANGTWTDYIYASSDDAIGNDIFLGSYSYTDNIAAGSSIIRTENVLLPAAFNPSYRLVVRTDFGSQIPESNEVNNSSISTAAIQVTAPDLLVSGITTLQETISGQPLNVSWTISNQGTNAANGTWTDYIYASSDDVIGNDLFLGAYTTSTNIGVGSSITRSENVLLPLDFAGSYRLVVRTDLNSQLSEINESNNNSIDDQAILVRLAPIPNLTVASITPPATAFSSQSTVVTWSVTNTGTGATTVPNWYDSVYLSLDSTIDDTDRLLGYAINPSYLDINGSYTNSLTVTLPQGISGNYRFLVRTDAFNNLNELSGENDNIGVSSITAVTLTPPPDLQVVAVNAPSGALSGQPINLSWTVANQGEGRTLETFWSDRIFMSQDAILDASDRFLGDVAHIGALVSGASYTSTASFALPIGVAGDFYFFVRSDVGNQVYENIYESNNVGLDSTPTTITLTPPPDLEFESLVLPTNARSGETLNISYRVTNFGATETPNGSWSDAFYLSTDDQFNATTDILLGSVGHYGILNPEQGYNGAASFNLSNSLTGTYYLFGIADNGDAVFELDNANNLIKSTNQVQIVSQPADLIVTNTVIPTAGEAGKTVQVQWTVKNQGIGNSIATGWTDRITASIDATLGNSDDVVLGNFSRNGLLAANASYSRTENIAIPFALESSYQLFVTTDIGNEVYESINENNNSSTASPIAINRQTPDLQVTAVTAPVNAASGQPFSLSWTVANLGAGKTNINYWYDNIYLSTDTIISADDISLRSVYHAGELEANATYNASATFTLPIDLTGTYNLLVRTDSGNSVLEGAFESNNDLANASPTTISLSAVPDLVVQSVNASTQGIAGQSINLTWTVANNGASASQNWYDAVYLSQDQVFNRSSDIYLGYQQSSSTLDTNGTYTTTRSFDLPRGLGGRYFAFVVTDSGNGVYERANENNNVNYDGLSTEIIIPPPSDLVVTNVTGPANGVLGQTASIGYTVTNQGTDTAYGTWSDALYLSTDTQWDINDQAIGQVIHSGDVAAGASYSGNLTTTLPGVNSGNYHVVVRSDIRNQVVEVSDANNSAASSTTIALNVEALTLGTPDTDSLGQGQAIYYRFDAVAGQAIRLKLNSSQDQSFNELYVRYGDVPTRGQFDLTTDQPFDADPEIVIPIEQTGTYYVLAYGDRVSGAAPYEIVAEEIPFSLTGVKTNVIGNSGESTLEIRGAKFSAGTKFELVAANGTVIQAENVLLENSTLAYVTFDLFNEVLGAYDVRAVQTGNADAVLADVVTVETAKGYDLDSNITGPEEVRPNRNYQFDVNYGNTGDIDSIAPLLIIESVNNTKVSTTIDGLAARSSLQLLGISGEGDRGIIRPGDVNTLPIYFNSNTDPIDFTVKTYSADNTTVIDWSTFATSIRPAGFTNTQWDNFVARIAPRVQTYGAYVKMLNDISEQVSAIDSPVYDVQQLLQKIYDLNPNYQPTSAVSGQILDAANGNPVAGVEVGAYEVRGESRRFAGSATTDAQGNYSLLALESGNYELRLRGSEIDQNRDGNVDTDLPGVVVSNSSDSNNVDIYAASPPHVNESKASTVVDSNGVSHIFWHKNGKTWHSFFDGTQWIQATAIPGIAAVGDFTVQAANNLLDGNTAGLVATWRSGKGNESKVYHSVSRRLASGEYEWSDPIVNSVNTVYDNHPITVIDSSGNLLTVYERSNYDVQDDSDLYYSYEGIQGSNLSWNNALASNTSNINIAPSASYTYEMTLVQGVTLPTWIPIIGGRTGINIEGGITGELTEKAVLAGQLKGAIEFTDRLEGNASAQGQAEWSLNKKKCVYVFEKASFTFGGELEGEVPFVPYSIGGVGLELGADVKIGLSGTASWSSKSSFPSWPDGGDVSLSLGVGPYGKAIFAGAIEAKVSGTISAKLQLYPKAVPTELSGELAGEVSLAGYKYIFKKTWTNDNLGFASLTGSSLSTASTIPDGLTIEYDPNSLTGTTNIYGMNSVLASVSSDLYNDSKAAITVGANNEILLAWAKEIAPTSSQAGSQVVVSTFNGNGWNSPTIIPQSLGIITDVQVAYSSTDIPLVVWSAIDSSGIVPNLSGQDFYNQITADADISYAVRQSDASWSTVSLSVAGNDTKPILGKDADNNLVLAWINESAGSDKKILTSVWNGSSWTTPITAFSGNIVGDVSLTKTNNKLTLFWTGDINPASDITDTSLFFSQFDNGWTTAQNFNPQLLIPQDSPTSSELKTLGLSLPTPPPELCKCEDGDPSCHDDDDDDDDDNDKYKPPVRRPLDPNDILGPVGFGESHWIDTDESLKYTIRFENATTATAPAQEVVITQQLDADLDWRTFRVDDYGWSGAVYELAGDRAFHRTRIDLTASKGYFVDIAVVIDVTTGLATWKISTIDPATGETPLNAQSGFLPTNNTEGAGEGFVSYSIKAKRTAQTGDIVDATAQIVFDTEEPINTPAIFNTLDVSKPTSQVQPLIAISETPEFLVSWSGTDVGSAIANYTVYVSDNDGAYTPWLTATGLTESTYTGLAGHTYEFYSVATDNAGNSQVIPTESQATIRVAGGVGSIGDTVWLDSNADGIRDQGELGLANVTVNLYNSASGLVATTSTSATGAYSFTEIPTGEYSVGFVAPGGYLFSIANQGTNDTLDSDPNITTGRTDTFTVAAGENLTWDAGLYQLGSIAGSNWQDSNGNGAKDAFETIGLAGWNVYLDTNENGLLDSGEANTTTDTNGSYSFLGLRPGNYTVAQVVEPGWIQTYPRIAVSTSAADIPLFVPSLSLESAEFTTSATVATTTPITNLIDTNGLWQNAQFANIKGGGFSTVIIDTGIDLNHPLFGADTDNNGVADRIVYQHDFADNDNDASDRNGHGSHVASIATQIAPEANLIVLKVFKDNLTGSFSYLEKALQWVNQNAATYNIASVNLSLGDSRNWNTTNPRYGIGDEIAAISSQNVIIAAAAGNSFYRLNSVPGVSYPAADTNTIAVGALWSDDFGGPQRFSNGAIDYTTGLDQIASFSQRDANLLDVFAPGVFISGANATGGTQSLGGTSQATPFVSGIAVLAQQIAYEKLGRKLTVNEFRQLLDNTSTIIKDGDNENDNVTNTGLNYSKINLLNLAQGVANFSGNSGGGITNPNINGGGTSTPSAVDTTILTHAVVLTSGQAVTNQDFGNQLLNTAPTAIDLVASINTLTENTSTIDRVKAADINITDDGVGTNALSLSGADASSFEIFDGDLYIKAGTILDFEPQSNYIVTVAVDDISAGATPDATADFSFTVTDVVESIIGISADPETLNGGRGADYLNGGVGDDYLNGGAGNDVLDGSGDSTGLNTFAGGTGDDIYGVYSSDTIIIEEISAGIDTVWTEVTYTISANVENLYLVGDTAGTGNAGDNIVTGYGMGNNTINGGDGRDTLYGGDGRDSLIGGLDADYLDGGADNDVLDGSGDSIGLDTFAGGTGDDAYGVYNSDTTITENAGEGIDTIWTAVDYLLPANVENLYLIGDTAGTGNAGDNIISGYGVGNNTINGGAGRDILIGGLGADYLDGGADNDVLDGSGDSVGLDTFTGGAGDDVYSIYNSDTIIVEEVGAGIDTVWTQVNYTISANVENLYLVSDIAGTGNAGDNIISGYGVGDNIINGGDGRDSLYGGDGRDSLIGGLGVDYLDGGADNDVLDGSGDSIGLDTFAGGTGDDVYGVYNSGTIIIENAGAGTDSVWTEENYTLAANVEILYLTSNNAGTGNVDANTIVGYGAGDNIIDGGDGIDNLFGGAGNDTFILSKTSADNIGDFGVGNDRLQISASAFGGGLTADVALQASQLLLGANTADTVDQRFIFDIINGDLFFDADGSDTTSIAVKIGKLSGTSSLNVGNFVVV